MAASGELNIHRIALTLRFIQGYRYLDRCGEAMIHLEGALGKDWIPSEPSPQRGAMKNEVLGMTAVFNAESLSVFQSDFISQDHFRDQACRIFHVLWKTFEVKRINVPAITFVLQRGFPVDEMNQAVSWLDTLRLCTVRPGLIELIGGEQDALDFTLVTKSHRSWDDQAVEQRRRMVVSVVRQERQMPFEERLLRRVKTLPAKQFDAVQGMLRIRRQLPDVSPVAAQIELENSFETEFESSRFDLADFLDESWQWSEKVAKALPSLDRRS